LGKPGKTTSEKLGGEQTREKKLETTGGVRKPRDQIGNCQEKARRGTGWEPYAKGEVGGGCGGGGRETIRENQCKPLSLRKWPLPEGLSSARAGKNESKNG